MKENDNIEKLKRQALTIRQDLIKMNWHAGSSHIGGSLSVVDILISLYHEMKVDPKNPQWEERDRLIMSKGHAAGAWYTVLASHGYFPKERLFDSFIKAGGFLPEHADMTRTPGVDMSSGSLGQGLSVACGMAWAAKRRYPHIKIYVILGDGELQEGQVWEAAMAAGNFKLDNLMAIVDYNKLQVNGPVDEIMSLEPLVEKWKAFKWAVREVDGHDVAGLLKTIREDRKNRDKPSVLIAHTIKGKGVSFLENDYHWHAGSLNENQVRDALKELGIE